MRKIILKFIGVCIQMNTRPATYADFFGHHEPWAKQSEYVGESVARTNVEFGAKKFIKP